MKRLIAGMAAALLAAVLFFPFEAESVSAQSGILMDAATGRVLYEKQADRKSLIASTTKIMTALVVCEQCNVLDRVRIPPEAVGIEGSSMYLQPGQVLTVQELLYGLMLASGNDAATALAIYCGGTVEGFSQLMNDKAALLGLDSTHFVNPHGLDAPGHYSTARDLARLGAYAMENPVFAKTVSARTVTVGQRQLQNHNKLLWQVEGADGIKTGYTQAAGRILVSSALRQGRRLVAVTINDPADWQDHADLLNRGFSRYTPVCLARAGERLGSRTLLGGEAATVDLIAGEDFFYALAEGEAISVTISGPDFAYGPVVRGQEAGCAYFCLAGRAVGKVPVYYGQTVEMRPEPEPSLLKKLFGGNRL